MENNNNSEFLTLKDLWEILLNNIWLFITSVVLSVLIAVAYILATPPQYQRQASILIKDNEQGKSISSQATQGFESLGLFQSNTNINNEINVIMTASFMGEVVNRLGLQYNYKVKEKGIMWVDLYKSSPFEVKFDSTFAARAISFDIEFISSDKFRLIDVVVDKEDLSEEFTGTLQQPISTPFGTITLVATPFFNNVDSEDGRVEDKKYRFAFTTIKTAVENYLEVLMVTLRSQDASIIDITITDENIERAENILNTLISVYNENWIKDKNEITFNTSEFIDDRLSIIERELENVDENIADFKSKKLIPDVAAVAGIQLEQSTNNSNEQLAIKNQLSMAHYIQDYLKSNSNDSQLLPINSGIDNNSIETLITQYNDLVLQKNMLLANSSEKNPLVAEMITNLQSIRGVINTSIDDHISTLSIQLKNLESESRQNRQNLSSTPKQAKELLGVERQQKIKEELFLYLLQKREENELSQTFSSYNTKILSFADGSLLPIKPRKAILLLFAMIIGVIIPVVYLIIKESLNTTVSSKKDIAILSKIPFIGTLPRVDKAKGKANKSDQGIIAVSSGNRDIINEAFRVIRTNLDFMSASKEQDRAQVMQIISMNPGSGKSFISVNLALSLALKDSKVLLVDGDIRKGTLYSYFDIPQVGISEYLSGKNANINELIIKGHTNDNLDILPVGKIPPNPSELLLKPQLAELIEQLKGKYNYILIDCPPVDIVPDSAIIGKLCDSAIFVIRAGKFDKRALPDIAESYESKKYNNMSILLNDVQHSGRGYYGYQKYGYYGYGYSKEL